MPKPLIHVSFAPSRLAFVSHLALSLVIALALGYWLKWWTGMTAALVLGPLAYLEAQRVPRALRLVREGLWETMGDSGWYSVSLQVIRLGPKLIGLDIAGKRYWIWPDSAPEPALRHLRRALLRVSSSAEAPSSVP